MAAASDSIEQQRVLQLNPRDNVLVALSDLRKGERITFSGSSYTLVTDVPAKHKFATESLGAGWKHHHVRRARRKSDGTGSRRAKSSRRAIPITKAPSTTKNPKSFAGRLPTFRDGGKPRSDGYHRADGQVGTRNYWLVVPLVFCENRNIAVLKQAFEEELGFAAPQVYRQQVAEFVRLYRSGPRE